MLFLSTYLGFLAAVVLATDCPAGQFVQITDQVSSSSLQAKGNLVHTLATFLRSF
jgi:hypothetical protein